MAKLTDYKFWYVKREGGNDDCEFITEVVVNFYEGEMEEEMQPDPNALSETPIFERVKIPVSVYKRKTKINDQPPHNAKKKIKDVMGEDAILYTQDDFGVIRTEEELKTFLKAEIEKDISRKSVV